MCEGSINESYYEATMTFERKRDFICQHIDGECEGDRVYHCARNYTDKNLPDPTLPRGYAYIEACARDITCRTGIKRRHGSFYNMRLFVYVPNLMTCLY